MIGALLLAVLVQTTDTAPRRVDGRVVRGLRSGMIPIVNQWVVMHRVGHDRSGPLDSMRTGANGRFSFRYRPSGDTSAIYFATTSYGGIVYPTAPFRAPVVSGDDAMLTVFDTTSGPVAIKTAGRHLIIGAPNGAGRRPVGEVYDLSNDSTVTAISRDSMTPVWTVHIPASAVEFQLNASGELAAGAIARRGSSVGLYAPVSPGLRQMAFTYELPVEDFPLRIPVERPTGIFELLVQEPAARIKGLPVREVPPEATEGRVFRRFLAQDVAPNAVLQIDIPHLVGAERNKVYGAVGIVLLIGMTSGLVFAAKRSKPAVVPGAVPVESPAEALVRRLAALDEAFEKTPAPTDDSRAAYDRDRADLKRQLANAMTQKRSNG